MNSVELEAELKLLDDRFSVSLNPNRPGLSNIFFEGKNYDLPVISTNDTKDEPDQGYRYEFPNGMTARYWSRGEIIGRCEDFLKKYKEGKMEGYHED